MKPCVLLCNGLSGSGKSFFIKNYLPADAFYKLRSATTRPMRDGEIIGQEYFFLNEAFFDTARLATRLWVNERIWQPGQPKWLYGVPESEIFDNPGTNLVYDVIEPKYARQLIDWFHLQGLGKEYAFKTLYFLPPENNFEIAQSRANMPNDATVRHTNTCNPIDFLRAGLDIDFLVKCSAGETIISPRLRKFISRQAQIHQK